MNESKPVDLELIADLCDRRLNGFASIEHESQLMDVVSALCDEVESLRARVKELEGNWAALKGWLNRDKENGSGHKVSRALFLMAEIEDAMIKERNKG